MGNDKYLLQSDSIGTGKIFIDPLTGLTLGIRSISYDRLAAGSITFPNSPSEELNNVGPGQKWNFTFNGKNFELVILELNYLYDSYKVQIAEK
jgi:hypothetical protein